MRPTPGPGHLTIVCSHRGRWYPDVHIYGMTTGADVASLIEVKDDWGPASVIGSADADQLAQIIGPHDHYIFRHTESSALIIREE
jgi:hypothetical protein